jgi:hypothetical protein
MNYKYIRFRWQLPSFKTKNDKTLIIKKTNYKKKYNNTRFVLFLYSDILLYNVFTPFIL